MRKQTPYQFFKQHAGYSWNSTAGETQAEGRTRCARDLAAAEDRASDVGVTYEWSDDDEPFVCECGECDKTPHPAYCVLARTANGKVFASLCGVTFKDDGGPFDGDPYRRVVEAELALELPDDETGEDGDMTATA